MYNWSRLEYRQRRQGSDAGRGRQPAGGIPGLRQGSAYVFDLGINSSIALYGVNQSNNSLVIMDLLQQKIVAGEAIKPVPIADNVVQLKALYGISASTTDLPVSRWVKPIGNV